MLGQGSHDVTGVLGFLEGTGKAHDQLKRELTLPTRAFAPCSPWFCRGDTKSLAPAR